MNLLGPKSLRAHIRPGIFEFIVKRLDMFYGERVHADSDRNVRRGTDSPYRLRRARVSLSVARRSATLKAESLVRGES